MTGARPSDPGAGPAGGDLAGEAARRAGRARVLGLLLVAEPGERELELAAAVPSLAGLTGDLGTVRADYGTVLLRGVACHESVFLGPDGRLGNVPGDLLDLYRRWDFAWEGRWRVAAPDHLGVQLLAYAHLCETEAGGWAGERADRALEAVEAQRRMLRGHLGLWAPVAVEAVRRAGPGTLYAEVALHLAEFLAGEGRRLRPAASHPGVPPLDVLPLPRPAAAGPGRIARALLAPACTGGYLLAADAGALAAAVGAPWRPSDTRAALRHVVEAAWDSGRLQHFAAACTSWLDGWAGHWRAALADSGGTRLIVQRWLAQADAARAWVNALVAAGSGDRAPVLCVPDEAALARAVAELSAAGLVVTVEPAPSSLLREVDAVVRLEPGRPACWDGEPPAGLDLRG